LVSDIREYRLKLPRKIFGSKKDEVIRGWRKCIKEKLNDLCSLTSTHIITMIKAIRMRSEGIKNI
jgi:hypothetical protein